MPDIPIPLVGPSNQGEHVKADSQRSINLIPYKIERENEKTRWHLVGAPGNLLFGELDKEPQRAYYVFSGRPFVISGSSVYELYEDGTSRDWGTIASVDGRCTIAELNGVLVIGDGAGFYSFDPTAGTIATIPDAPIGRFCFALNQRIHYVQRDSGQVFYSELLDPTNIPGLNFYTAENLPDNIVMGLATEDQAWFLGVDGAEVWYDTGDAETPYQRVPGGVVRSGCLAPDTALYLDNSVWWVEKNADGLGVVRRTQGFTPVRVSVSAVERFTSTATNLTAYAYQEQGHTYYALNADEGTWALDLATNEWHERAWLYQARGELKRARAEMHMFAFGKHLVADWENGNVYDASQSYYDDNGDPLIRRRISGHIDLGGANITVDEVYVDVATGVGLATGQGSDPLLMFRYSRDGGQNWSNELHRSLGPIGKTATRVRVLRLGTGRDWVFEVSVSDPVQVVILGAVARVRQGRR